MNQLCELCELRGSIVWQSGVGIQKEEDPPNQVLHRRASAVNRARLPSTRQCQRRSVFREQQGFPHTPGVHLDNVHLIGVPLSQ